MTLLGRIRFGGWQQQDCKKYRQYCAKVTLRLGIVLNFVIVVPRRGYGAPVLLIMAKVAELGEMENSSPGLPYYPIDRHGNPLPIEGRSANDPPPYYEVDPTLAASSVVPNDGSSRGLIARAASVIHTRGSTPTDDNPIGDSSVIPIVTRGVPLASKSIDVVCPRCQTDIRTSIEKKPGLMAYLSGVVMACLCCWCGCCLIPCCIEDCMEVKHTCPNCDHVLGKFRN